VTTAADTPVKSRKVRRRLIIAGLVVVGVIALVVGLIGRPAAPTATPQITSAVTTGDVSLTVDASGQVVDQYTFSVAPETSAVLTAIAGVSTGSGATAMGYTTSSVDVSVGQVVAAGQNLATVYNSDDESFSVPSPHAGTVRSITTANEAVASQVATIGVGAPVVSVQVSEYDIAAITLDQTVAVTLGSSDEEFTGTVSSIAQVSTNTSGVEQYQVVISSDEMPEGTRIGMTATASIVIDSREGVLTVPPSALTTVGDITLVTVQNDDGTTETVPVEVGLVGNSSVEILSGLSEGDTVVIGTDGDVPVVDAVTGPPGFGG
jgi:multidrug efflux pump subunit AcrA (membrane-fusion protein)